MKKFLFFLATAFFLSGCVLINGFHQKEAEEETQIFGTIKGYNPQIEELQRRLRQAGHEPGTIDGKIGWQTRKAVKDFQKENKLKETGYIDAKTHKALRNRLQKIEPPSKAGEKFKKGPTEEASVKQKKNKEIGPEEINASLESPLGIKKVQRALKNAGFDPGATDGKIGAKTKKAIRSFQKSRGLVPDGVVGPKTWRELSKYFPKE